MTRIAVVRLGALGDVVHTLPAVADLRRGIPDAHITWIVDPRWAVVLEGNPQVDEVWRFTRKHVASYRELVGRLRSVSFDLAVDFQGLIKSAFITAATRARVKWGFASEQVRERPAALFYGRTARASAAHVVDRNRELAWAAGGAKGPVEFPMAQGVDEGGLPEGEFVLACPLAGWPAKQWPLEHYGPLARRLRDELGWTLVLNGPPSSRETFAAINGAWAHASSIAGLIDATRRARAVVGLDSGPLHIAAALGKPGVALFGPTDPERNGPYGGTMRVLRHASAVTTYKRKTEIDPALRAIGPDEVFEALAR